MDIYREAALKQVRFDTPKGSLVVEDLFHLPLVSTTGKINLNDLAVGIHNELNLTPEVTFVDTAVKSKGIRLLELKLNILKDVISYKIAERDSAAQATAKREQKQKIMALIDQKKDDALAGKSVEELQALVDAL